jgi:hypothetical protein
MFVIDVNAYGTYARPCAIADFLELMALRGREPSEIELAEHIVDSDWVIDDMFLDVDEGRPMARRRDDATEQARTIYAALEERQHMLADKWPFRFDGPRLVAVGREVVTDPYVALLSVTLAHAYDIATPHAPELVFEGTVADIFARRDLLVSNFGRVARGAPNFEQALLVAGAEVLLSPTPEAAIRKVHAQDGKVDTLCHTWWGDTRPGVWCLIGQVTCAKSDAWEGKIMEPSPFAWSKLLNVEPLPLAFLAVPHHVGSSHLAQLVQDHHRVVFDRLRLAMFKAGVLPEEREVIESVMGTEVEQPWS